MSERINFGKLKEGAEPPNLIEVQLNSYVEFLQKDVPPGKRKEVGLQAVFNEVFRIITIRDSWLEVQFDVNDLLYIYLDRCKRRRKFLSTSFLRALGYGTDEEIIKIFYNVEDLALSDKLEEEEISSRVFIADVRD